MIRKIGRVGLGIVALLLAVWAMFAIYYSNLPGRTLRGVAALAFVFGTVTLFWKSRSCRRAWLIFLASVAGVSVWWNLIPASNQRDWKPEVAVLPMATIAGDAVTIRNIRNLDYRTETDFTPRYYNKTFDLRQLNSVDLICVYWGSDAIAHVMVSFGFGGKDFVCFSIERRDERGESYSTWKGLFHQYELYYVVADERDVIRVRTNFRQPEEQVYLFRTRVPLENQRKLFLDYVRRVNELAEKPDWYNTVTDNCTTGVLLHTRAYQGRARYNWKILLSGYTAQYAYEVGGLDSSISFEELRQRGHVNARAHAAGTGEDFSQRIREGIPQPQPWSMDEFRGAK